MQKEFYIVSIQDQEDKIQYICEGEYSYYDLTQNFGEAKRFDSVEEAESILSHQEFTKRNVFADKSSAPPHILWSGLGINNTRPEADGFINIVKIQLNDVKSIYVKDKLEGR